MLKKLVVVLGVVILWVVIWGGLSSSPQTDLLPAPKTHQALVYPVDDWAIASKKSINNLQDLLQLAGTGARQDTGLDFDGLPNTLYRFHSSTEAPFYVGVSGNYLEIVWYYASPKDDDRLKALSVEYAKKAHAISTSLLGVDGHRLTKAILQGKSATATGVKYAQCSDYQCQLVLKR